MRTVLIVDDSAFMRNAIKQCIKQNYKVVAEAKDGHEAIEYFQRYLPDIVLLDLTMPIVDGLTALKEIIKIDSKANIIVFSSWATKFTIKDAILFGAKDFVIKPNFQQLMPILGKIK